MYSAQGVALLPVIITDVLSFCITYKLPRILYDFQAL